ncbi:hypothetical protein [Ekhidna sp.]|uniref:hypothetical protein n=1 Tax=Ekhidna sp. TaxID=2608089 RepID=UPI003BA927DC
MKKYGTYTLLIICSSMLTAQNLNSSTDQIEYQIGKWQDDEVQEANDGRTYQFNYELKWFDRKNTIIKMHITGVYSDGEVRTFWEGFKYWNIVEEKFLYNGFSPDGRIASGYLKLDNKIITTHYSSNSPNGKIQIKDVANKIDNDHFTTITYLKMPGETEWKVVNEDNWTRID